MTGYASAVAQTSRGALTLELRSVNSRFLDIQLRIAEELRGMEPVLRALLAVRLARGKVDCRLSLGPGAAQPRPGGARPLNAQALEELQHLSAEARRAFPDATPLRLADVLRWPGVLADPPTDDEAMHAAVDRLARQALDELVAAREREGAKLAVMIQERIAQMRRHVAEAATLLPEAQAAWKAKLIERLAAAQVAVDDDRIRAELALQAAKGDVDEELTRLGAHLSEVERTLSGVNVAGKRLDFLAQELNREANTLASKASGLKLADCALELKVLIEQVREQVQNVE